MYKSERQSIALLVGGIMTLVGVLTMVSASDSPWIIEETLPKIMKMIGGGFIALVGAVIFLSGISEDALESVSDLLGYLWDRFLKALGG